MTVELRVDGTAVSIEDDGCSLLEALRDRLGVRSAKDGCSPQGQCGCCTVLVDGSARVACVTPLARVAGRAVTTVEGLVDADRWAAAFCAAGASQCGFCTPGIVVRLASLGGRRDDAAAVEKALLAHLCRCTGWRSIVDAALRRDELAAGDGDRDLGAAARRAAIEGRTPQAVGPAVALGSGGFAADTAPDDALVALRRDDGEWVVGTTLTEARRLAGRVQGRRTTAPVGWPIDVPDGGVGQRWMRTLQTTWVEPAALEPDAAWCLPGGVPSSPLANGGAFGAKERSPIGAIARQLADRHGAAVLALMTREDTVRLGPKRPPLAVGIDASGAGIVRVARPAAEEEAGLLAALAAVAPALDVELVAVPGPPVSTALRASGWAECAAVLSSLGASPDRVVGPDGGVATAVIERDGSGADRVSVTVRCGEVLDEVVLRSYCVGAAHMALGLVRSEGIAVDPDGVPLDLTMRSFGILRAVDTPAIDVRIEPADGPPVNGSDAVFAAVAAAAWRHAGFAPRWPVNAARAAR